MIESKPEEKHFEWVMDQKQLQEFKQVWIVTVSIKFVMYA
jgi:hypothetical protein